MATARKHLVDPDQPLFYHLVSRCVRRAWLCGYDPSTRTDYTHRKTWLIQRLKRLSQAFALDVYAYAIMSNHFHLVVYYDPCAPQHWSAQEVAERWLMVCPPRLPNGEIDEGALALRREVLLEHPDQIERLRAKLGSLSLFMKLLKQPIARRANLEDDCQGHFFEQRFYSGALLSEAAVVAAMAYVDLNPVRAKIVASLAEAKHTSFYERSHDPASALSEYLAPVCSGLTEEVPRLRVCLGDYMAQVEAVYRVAPLGWTPRKLARWRDQVASLKRRQRVYGPSRLISSWLTQRGFQSRELALPQ